MTARIHILHPSSEPDTWAIPDLPAVDDDDPMGAGKALVLGTLMGSLFWAIPIAVWWF
jgi:hypothetical protein